MTQIAKEIKVAVKTQIQKDLEKARAVLKDALLNVKNLNQLRKAERAEMKKNREACIAERAAKREATKIARETKRAEAIKRAEDRLAKLKARAMINALPPVGKKAIKASKRPSKVIVTKPNA